MSRRDKTPPSVSSNALSEGFSETFQGPRAFWDENGAAYLEKATQYAEMGRFQILLLIVCLIAFSNTSTVPNILNKFSNAIQCDFQLVKEDKKAINDVVYVCMILGGVAWSILADTISRKWTLVLVLLVYTISTIGLTLADSFLLFGLFRGLGSFSRSGIPCIIITFISEFQISYFRGSMICCLQLAWILGMVAIPSLPFTWQSLIWFSTIPSMVAMVGVLFFPDPPRFLLSRGRNKAALRSLQMIHAINTGTNKIYFPIRSLKDNITPAEMRRNSVVKTYIPPHMEPKFICIPIIMLTQFVLMFSYYTLALWFPHMVARTEAFFPLARVEDIPQDCKFGVYHADGKAFGTETTSKVEYIEGDDEDSIRVTPIDNKKPPSENPCNMYEKKHFDLRSSTLDALTSMPSIIWLVLKIDTMGRKFFMILAHVVAGCLTFASYFMHNVKTELLFSCLFDLVTLLSISASHCLAVELFPTKVRVFGVALVIGSGQLGAILADIGGAISFGLSCVAVVALTAIGLAITGMLLMTLPDTTGITLR